MSRACSGRLSLLLAFWLVAGCYSSGIETADGRDDAGTDGAAAETGPDATCTTPQYWSLEEQEILRFEAIDPPHGAGSVMRVFAFVEMSGAECAEYAGQEVVVAPAMGIATVTIFVWWKVDALAGPCAPAEPTPVVVKLAGLAAGTWIVMDGAAGPAGDPVTQTYEVEACDAGCSCLGEPENRPQGADCTLDCQCQDGFSCIGYLGITGMPLRTCQRSCSDDRDCPAQERCMDWDDGPSRVCELMPTGCAPPTSCPVGESCPCEPAFDCFCDTAVAAEPGDVPCCRDDDCPAGNVCISTRFGPYCAVPCRHAFNCTAQCWSAEDDGPGLCWS